MTTYQAAASAMSCPTCGAAAGQPCRTNRGRPITDRVHLVRLNDYRNEIGREEWERRHGQPRATKHQRSSQS